jgi:transposase InsO family protein
VFASAVKAGRATSDVEVSLTVERALPNTSAESQQLLDELSHLAELGVQHFVMDFGHPQTNEPVLRFVEEVMTPLRRG